MQIAQCGYRSNLYKTILTITSNHSVFLIFHIGSVRECVSEASVERYLLASDTTRSLINFVKVAYPDMVGAQGSPHLEELYEKDRKVCRSEPQVKFFLVL